ncbi:MAG: GNAT family N-acetyltransferase [Peptostreptococcaceae bacterium]|nr:GNAT family N-acetyltransferase [Peptostreptococcaceae bacterium]
MKIKWVKATTDEEIEMLWKIYQSNAEYFLMTSGEKVERQTLIYNLQELPPNCKAEQKEFLLIYYDGYPMALMDLIANFPDEDCAYIGLFLVEGAHHSHGIGEEIFEAIEEELRKRDFQRIRLGVIEQNKRGLKFWEKVGFVEQKIVNSTIRPDKECVVHVMEKKL